MDCSILKSMAQFCADLAYDDLTDTDKQAVKRCVLDYLAASVAGFSVNKTFSDALFRVMSGMGGIEESTVMFYRRRLPAANAAFMNGVLSHGADMDDGFRTAQGHPGASIISAAFALAEREKTAADAFFPAVAAGYEVFAKLGTAVNPYHALSGFHSTGTVGTVAAAAAAGRMLNLPPQRMLHAIGFGCMQAAGLLEVVENGQQSKPINTGRAAQSGVLSALWAEAGACAPTSILEGKKGFLNAFSENAAASCEELHFKFPLSVDNGYFKAYPACRHTHGAIDLALDARAYIRSTKEIQRIIVSLYPIGIRVAGGSRCPADAEQAKFSLRYTVAAALYYGRFSLEELNVSRCLNEEILRLQALIEICEDTSLEDKRRNVRGAGLAIIGHDGVLLYDGRKDRPYGENPDPIPWSGLVAKLDQCAGSLLDEERKGQIVRSIEHLESGRTAVNLLSLMQTDSQGAQKTISCPD